ncbi:MAG: helix-turn-helix domain-containing protein [Clostridia bacterium]|nr:helix-turn-helix domain-containing protein [Clostridia bacterium]
MQAAERLVSTQSEQFFYAPSQLAREHFLYSLCAGNYEYLPGYALRRSSYESWLLEVILSGSVTLESEGFIYHAQEGDAVLLDCHQPHSYHSAQGWRALWVHFDGPPMMGYASLFRQRFGSPVFPDCARAVRPLLERILRMLSEPTELREAEMNLCLTEALTLLTESSMPQPITTPVDELKSVLARINRQLGREIDVDEMARMSSLSKYHFIRVFQKSVGMTPRQYVIAVRMNHAKYLLTHTDLTVGTLAERVGYASESMFCATFKRTQGITPTEYRRSRKETKP